MLALLIAGALIAGVKFMWEEKYLFFATGSMEKAILNSTWLMSPKEVSRSNNARLKKEDIDAWVQYLLYPRILNVNRYAEYAQKDIWLWGVESEIKYQFFDNKLFGFTLIMNPPVVLRKGEGNKLIKDYGGGVLDHLVELFTKKHGVPEENNQTDRKSSHNRLIEEYKWLTSHYRVEIYLIKNDETDTASLTARVTYLPYYREIERTAGTEQSNYY